MHVTDPNEAVSLHAIPQVFLHVQVHGVGTCLPDAVQPLVVRAEAASVGNIPQGGYGTHLFQL